MAIVLRFTVDHDKARVICINLTCTCCIGDVIYVRKVRSCIQLSREVHNVFFETVLSRVTDF